MVFAPKLEAGIAYNQPVQTPSAMGALASLFDFSLSTLQANAGSTPKPTEGDKFDLAIGEFVNSKGGAFSWDKRSAREFIFQNPQFANEMKSYLEGTGVFDTPQAVAEDASMKIFETPEGQLAVATASSMEPEEQQAYLSQFATTYAQQNAELAKLQREAATLEAAGTLDAKRWDALKPVSKDMVDNTVSTVLAPIVQDVMNGNSVSVPEELKQLLGIRYDTIDMNNLPAVLADTKTFLGKQARGAYVNNFGEDILPSEEWNKEVFGSIDGLIEVGKSIDSPQERTAAMQAIIESKAFMQLDEAGVAVTLEIIKSLPEQSAAELLALPTLYGPLKEILANGSTLFSSKEIATNAAGLSVKEAKDVATDTIQIIDKGITPEFFTAFKESAKRSGYDVVDSNSFKSIIGNNIEEIKRLSTSNPEFRAEMTDFLNSDIQQTISLINSNLPTEVRLIQQKDGKFALTYTGTIPERGARASALESDYDFKARSVREATKGLPDGLNLDTLNEKLGALGLLGDVGKEVQESIGILNQTETNGNTRKATAGGGRARGRNSGKGTVDVGVSLGIDFTAYETEAGLPLGYLNKLAMIESGGNPSAQNSSSSAGGLFQQIDSNAAAYGVSDRFDPVQSTEGAVAFAVDNTAYLTKVLGREPTGGELYLAHQQGPGGAAKLLSNPNAKAVDIVGMDAINLNGGNANMTAGEFANIWISKYNGSRGEVVGSPDRPVELQVDTGAEGIPTTPNATSTASTDALKGNVISYDSPEVQKLIEMSQSAPQEVVKMAKELLSGKPIDPQVKALIEALVRIGEK